MHERGRDPGSWCKNISSNCTCSCCSYNRTEHHAAVDRTQGSSPASACFSRCIRTANYDTAGWVSFPPPHVFSVPSPARVPPPEVVDESSAVLAAAVKLPGAADPRASSAGACNTWFGDPMGGWASLLGPGGDTWLGGKGGLIELGGLASMDTVKPFRGAGGSVEFPPLSAMCSESWGYTNRTESSKLSCMLKPDCTGPS